MSFKYTPCPELLGLSAVSGFSLESLGKMQRERGIVDKANKDSIFGYIPCFIIHHLTSLQPQWVLGGYELN